MPIFEFVCGKCGERFEELVAAAAAKVPCPACGSRRVRKTVSAFAVTGEARQAGGHAGCSGCAGCGSGGGGCGSGGGHKCGGCGGH
ncbi:MAG: FmdB family zinc ribbon protein [Candidatus Krumholzibacteriia bacterium]